MKKRFFCISIFAVLTALCVFANIPQPKTEKFKAEGKSNAFIYMTEIYRSEYWAEFYCTYEEDKNTYDEAETEKILYEFISNYKRDHKFSRVEIEDLKGSSEGEKTITMQKRIIFRQIRK